MARVVVRAVQRDGKSVWDPPWRSSSKLADGAQRAVVACNPECTQRKGRESSISARYMMGALTSCDDERDPVRHVACPPSSTSAFAMNTKSDPQVGIPVAPGPRGCISETASSMKVRDYSSADEMVENVQAEG